MRIAPTLDPDTPIRSHDVEFQRDGTLPFVRSDSHRSLSLKKLALTEIRVAARPPSLHRDD